MPGERTGTSSTEERSANTAEATTDRTCSRLMAPCRSTTGRRPVQSTTVDSRPTSAGPPWRIHGMRPFISSTTAFQVVGLGRPDRFAEGAATGTPHAFRKACATGWAGHRTPTVSRPADTSSGIAACRGTITVNGPGQNRSINRRAMTGTRRATPSSMEGSAMCTINGLSAGRPLARKIARTAWPSNALAPKP